MTGVGVRQRLVGEEQAEKGDGAWLLVCMEMGQREGTGLEEGGPRSSAVRQGLESFWFVPYKIQGV